jgi:predicted enzyme related to lactoylglutathione lyase
MSLLPFVCVLANDIDRVSAFLIDVFQCKLPDITEKPVRHRVIRISDESSVMVVQKAGCDERTIASVSLLAVHHVFVVVLDVAAIQLRATSAGATVTQSDVDEKGGSICILEGPERIYFHIISREKQGSINTHDLAMSTIWSRLEQTDVKAAGSPLTPATHKTASAQRAALPRRPIIPTMDVHILSNNSKSFVSFPPNSREAVAFETELFKGTALLICKTTPPDEFYKCFFEGK